MRRIAVGGIVHETNSFVPALTTLDDFTGLFYDEDDALIARWAGSRSSLGGVLQALRQGKDQPVPLLYTTAMPSGTVQASAYQTLSRRLIETLASAGPVDGVLLVLHGAMLAEGVDDCEGDLLRRVRDIVGDGCPVVAVLDMHGNLTPAMVEMADVLIGFNRHPHTDTFQRGLEAVATMRRLFEQKPQPTAHLVSLPLLPNALTTATARLPLSAGHHRAEDLRTHPSVLNISIMGGFAYSDTYWAGTSVLVTTANDAALARDAAESIADAIWQHRDEAKYAGLPVAEAVERALNATRFPVILADVGDNVGGGSPGDGTVLLDALLASNAQGAVVTIADAEAVAKACHAGEGNEVELRIGGRHDTLHGDPVSLRGRVERLTDGRYAVSGADHFANIYGREVRMGRCAIIRVGGVRILLTERRIPPGDLAQLRSQGIVPEEQSIIVVKSPIAFRGAYEPIAGEIYEVDTPGVCAANLGRFDYRHLRRPIVPLDDRGGERSAYVGPV